MALSGRMLGLNVIELTLMTAFAEGFYVMMSELLGSVFPYARHQVNAVAA